MRKKYINLLVLGSCLSIATIIAANVGLFSQKNSSTNINNTTINKINNDAKYYHANGFLLSVPSQNVTIDNITYSLNSSQNTACVINVKSNLGTLTIPSSIEYNNNYYNVTSIGNGACYNKQITNLVLSNNIVSIGADAFANNLLTNITLPPYLTSLGNNAFSNNPFTAGTVVNLPSNCNWNKTASLAPFNNNDNMGNFARCVKYIIQNLAVYGYVYGANSWQIVSWMPQVENAFPNAVRQDNYIFNTVAKYNSITQRPTSTSYSASLPFLGNASLLDTAIANVSWGSICQAYGFEPQSNSNLKFYWTNKYYDANNSFVLTVYNPITSQQIYDNQNNYGNKSSILINYGDIIGIKYRSGNWNLYNGLPAFEMNGKTLNSCAGSLSFSDSYSARHDQTNYYEITKSGLIPYQNILHVNVNCLQESKSTFDLTGIALANHEIIATINNQIFYGLSNSQGYFSIPIILNSPLALGAQILVNCVGCIQFNGNLIGANPIDSGLLFEDDADFGILPDGYTGNYQLWNNSQSSMPIYNNPLANTNDLGYNSNSKIVPSNHPIIMTLTDSYVNNQNQTITSTVSINEPTSSNNDTNVINSELEELKFNPDYTNTLTLSINNQSKTSLYEAIANGNCIPINETNSSNSSIYTFDITNNSFYSPDPNASTWGRNFGYSGLGKPDNWAARSFCLVSGYTGYSDGTFEDDNNKENGLTPNQAMWTKVHQITAHCESTYEKALAINEWVSHNMSYTFNYSYSHTIAQTFDHLEGVCGNYAALSCVMCMMAGLVSRAVIGQTTGSANYFTPNYIDHCWMQVWDEQLGSWITLDPTWDWFNPYGTLQDQFNVCRRNEHVCLVLWPVGTTYFSHFVGHSYAALLNLANFFGYRGGTAGSYYPMQYGAYLSQLLHQAPSITGDDAKTVSF